LDAPSITLEMIHAAAQRLRGVALRTPLVACPVEDAGLWVKAENLQPIGSFKLRGAYNKISQLSPAELRRGVITYSSGNHAQGVAFAARALGARTVIVMPSNAPAIKRAATLALGAEIVEVGVASSDRLHKAEELVAKYGYAMIPPYDDEQIITGQATCGLEIIEEISDVDIVFAPVSGGGLLSGVATAIKLLNPHTLVIGVEPELAADAAESFASGNLTKWPAAKTSRTIADGLRTQSLGKRNFALIQKYVAGIVTVSEAEIRASLRRLVSTTRLIPEPSGAVAAAAVFFHRDKLPAFRKAVAIVSGGNLDPAQLQSILAGK